MTVIAEQPDDWTTPGAYTVAPGVFRIPVALPIDRLKAVNVYVIEDRDGLVAIETPAGPVPAPRRRSRRRSGRSATGSAISASSS